MPFEWDSIELSAFTRPSAMEDRAPDPAGGPANRAGTLPAGVHRTTSGIEPHSAEFAAQWTPILGPSAAVLYVVLVRLAGGLMPGRSRQVAVRTIGAAIGVGGRKAPRTVEYGLRRLERFELVTSALPYVAVQTIAPVPPRWAVARIGESWRREVGVAI